MTHEFYEKIEDVLDSMDAEKESWLTLADKFFYTGDFKAMRACAREALEKDAADLDAQVILAEASLYMGEEAAAKELAEGLAAGESVSLRLHLLRAELFAGDFLLEEEIAELRELLRTVEQMQTAERTGYVLRTAERAECLLADAFSLAAEPAKAAEAAFAASFLAEDPLHCARLYSNGLFLMNCAPISAQNMKALHLGYNDFFAGWQVMEHEAPLALDRKLRIGYISPDFRQHAAAYFLTPFLRDYDCDAFDVFCYAAGGHDRVTTRFRRFPVHWRDIAGLSPQDAARRIHRDGIDILVDFSGHAQGSCLPVLALKPAPVQISGIGYMNTTGLSAVDYFLADVHTMSGSNAADGFTEKVLRLPHSHLCYVPDTVRDMPPFRESLPLDRQEYVTFGCFNNFSKVTKGTLLLWRAILEKVPQSKLVIKAKICSIPSGRSIVTKRLEAIGIDMARIELRPYSPDYLEQYGDIDIALDTMPYNGGLTTCEALYMGVPVIALRGRSHGACFGVSLLENAGVPELLASSDMEYVAKAAHLALSPDELRRYRLRLRQKLQKSILMDGPGYMREMEAAYRSAWKEYCGGN